MNYFILISFLKKRNKIEQCNIFLYTLNQQYKIVKQRNVDRIMMQ